MSTIPNTLAGGRIRYRAVHAGTGRGWMVERRSFQNELWRPTRVDGPFTSREQAEARARELADLHRTIGPGSTFDTPFETGCVARRWVDDDGDFLARDSDGVVCGFNVATVKS